ncbi:MAG: hypothetical protein ACYTGN_04080 [Planctomycetota bacterium]|jgi:hypothetical protein
MRGFLPIKGPGGRALTPKEKAALVVLALTLVLCVLTLLAGEGAFSGDARNPVFALVSGLGGLFGGGIVGFYALVLAWSGLIYFKGERIADVRPFGGRLAAGVAVTIGISGALGIAHVETAGTLGGVIGGALAGTLGGTLGIVLLMGLMLLGIHIAGQGLWFALRGAPATASALPSPSAYPFEAADNRMPMEPPEPEDGDPSPDERTRAVTQAVEEIERSQGVTIVDVDETVESAETVEETPTERASIGEQVDYAPEPAPETEEAEIQRGLMEVSAALAREREREALRRAELAEEEGAANPLTPAPPVEVAPTAEAAEPEPVVEITLGPVLRDQPDEEPTDAVLEAIERELDPAPEPAAEPEPTPEPVAEVTEEEPDESEEPEEEEADPNYYEPTYQLIDNRNARPDEAEQAGDSDEPERVEEEAGFAATPAALDDDSEVQEAETEIDAPAAEDEDDYDDEPVDDDEPEAEDEVAEGSDPYARGGLLRRIQQNPDEVEAPENDRYASFDWRGRPIE